MSHVCITYMREKECMFARKFSESYGAKPVSIVLWCRVKKKGLYFFW